MAEQLWSGAGCADNPDFEFVKYSDSGVPLYRKVRAGRLQLRSDDGGTLIIEKRGAQPQEEKDMSLTESIAKALVPSEADDRRTRDMKVLIRHQIAKGKLSVEQVSGQLALEAIGKSLRDRDPTLSPEGAFVKAMDLHPDLAAMAYGR